MRTGRLFYLASTILIVVVLVVSGPLTGGIAFTLDEPAGFGYGTIELSPQNPPSEVSIYTGRFDAGLLVLSVPDTVIRIDQASGRPLVTYKLNNPEMGYVRQALHIIDADIAGDSYVLSLGETPIEPELVDQAQSNATISIEIRDDRGTRTAYSWNVSVVVTE